MVELFIEKSNREKELLRLVNMQQRKNKKTTHWAI